MPKEYIEREALLADIDKNVILPKETPHFSKEVKGAHNIISRIRLAPAADVVEVVRCGKCRFREPVVEGGKVFYVCNNINTVLVEVKPNEYCSFGQRKDGAKSEQK